MPGAILDDEKNKFNLVFVFQELTIHRLCYHTDNIKLLKLLENEKSQLWRVCFLVKGTLKLKYSHLNDKFSINIYVS